MVLANKYKRILLKLSGESLAGRKGTGIDDVVMSGISKSIKKCKDLGIDIAIVVGGGNFWRGRSSTNMNRTKADHIGMLATTMNAIYIADSLEHMGLDVRVQSAIDMHRIAEPYIRNKAIRHIEKGRIVIFAAGTGNPFFSTDTAAALRAAEIDADVILKATTVDGIYDSDPKSNPDAKKYNYVQHKEILLKDLKVMDSTAASLCRDNNIPILVFSIDDPENIVRAAVGEENIGTLVQ